MNLIIDISTNFSSSLSFYSHIGKHVHISYLNYYEDFRKKVTYWPKIETELGVKIPTKRSFSSVGKNIFSFYKYVCKNEYTRLERKELNFEICHVCYQCLIQKIKNYRLNIRKLTQRRKKKNISNLKTY